MTSTITLRAGDVLLLCTDGLAGVVPRESIVEVLGRMTDLGEACLALVNLAVRWGGPDNITALLARPEGAALRPPSAEDEVHEAEHHHIWPARRLKQRRCKRDWNREAGRF